MKKIAVLISGNGSNLQAMIDACGSHIKRGEIVAVFSNKKEAYGLERARQANIDAHFINPESFADRTLFDMELIRQIDSYQPDLIVLSGYMRILSNAFISHYAGKILNIHPSLLPKYPGLNTHQKAIDAGDSEHGTSVHFVTEELDGGPVILQAKVPVLSEDTIATLNERVQSREHHIYPLVINWFVEGRLKMENNQVILDGAAIEAIIQ